jgi:hypothetical protein
LSPRRVSLFDIAASACVAILTGLGPASLHAADQPPKDLADTIAQAAQACRQLGGKPDTTAILSAHDLNGDGHDDWIADFAKLKCDGAPNPLCNPDGCTLQLYFWDGEGDWDLVFEDFVESYKFSSSGGTHTMHVITSGLPCNKPADEACHYNYRLDKDAAVPVQ